MIGFIRFLMGAVIALAVGTSTGYAGGGLIPPPQPGAGRAAEDRAQLIGLAVALVATALCGLVPVRHAERATEGLAVARREVPPRPGVPCRRAAGPRACIGGEGRERSRVLFPRGPRGH